MVDWRARLGRFGFGIKVEQEEVSVDPLGVPAATRGLV